MVVHVYSRPCHRSLSSLSMWSSRLSDSIVRSLKFSTVLDISLLEYYKQLYDLNVDAIAMVLPFGFMYIASIIRASFF